MKKLFFTFMSLVFLILPIYGADTVVEQDEPLEVATEQITIYSKGAGQVQSQSLNLRENPNEDAKILKVLDEDDSVIVYDKVGGWYCVSSGEVTGYVFCDYLDFSFELENEFGFGKAAREIVNIRSGASTEKTQVGYLSSSDVVKVMGVEGEWFKVSVNGLTGYVRSDLIDFVDSEQLENKAENGSLKENEIVSKKDIKTAVQSNKNPSENPQIQLPEEDFSESVKPIIIGEEIIEEEIVEEVEEATYTPNIVEIAQEYLGVPYVWGGTSPSGFDCSGFTQYVFGKCGYSLSRIASAQYNDGTAISYDNLASGDLVFFVNTYATNGISHVGIYMGGGQFIHCANGGVKISDLSEPYYSNRYYGACRVIS